MPIYEYRCESCGHAMDALQKLADEPLKACPACGKLSLKRLVSAPAFRLKGSGWYETDFKTDGEKRHNIAGAHETAAHADKDAAAKGSDTSANKADSNKAADAATSDAGKKSTAKAAAATSSSAAPA